MSSNISCLLVGGDEGRNKKRIIPTLESMGVTVIDTWDMNSKGADFIPSEAAFVVLLTDLGSHSLYDKTKVAAKRQNKPIVMTPGVSTVILQERLVQAAESWRVGNKFGLGYVLKTIEEQMKKSYPPSNAVREFMLNLFKLYPYISNKEVKEHGDAWVEANYPGDNYPHDPGVLVNIRKELGIKKTTKQTGFYPATPAPDYTVPTPSEPKQEVKVAVPEPEEEVVLEPIPVEADDTTIPSDVRDAAELMLSYMRQHGFVSLKMTDDGSVDFTQRVIRHGKWKV